MQNRASRYHVLRQAVRAAAKAGSAVGARAEEILARYEGKLEEHHRYIRAQGEDMPEIADWKWTASEITRRDA